MNTFRNPHRIRELFTPAGMQEAAQTILSLRSHPVVRVLFTAWVCLLLALFTLIFTVRMALTFPMPW